MKDLNKKMTQHAGEPDVLRKGCGGVLIRRESMVASVCFTSLVNISRAIFCALILSLTSVCTVPNTVHSAEVPNFDQAVDFNVREQNVNDFLNALFQAINVPVSTSSSIEGNVNGQFSDSARNVFSEVATAFSIMVYFDGAVAHTYKKNEVSRRLVPVGKQTAARVLQIAKSMELADTQNTVELKDSGILVSGSPRFLAQLDEIVASVKSAPAPVTRKKKAATTKVAEKPVSFTNESPLVYQVFKLKHAWATDTTFPVGGNSVVVPGVATILQDLIFQENGGTGDSVIPQEINHLKDLKGQGLSRSAKSQNQHRTKPVQVASGPRIVADSRLNAVVIRDHEDRMPSYQRLIDSLDVESGMVEIEATIIDINTDKSRDLGVNWRYQGDNGSVLFGSGSASDQSLTPGNGPIASQGQGGILSLSLGEPANFLARVRALEQKGAARIISKPHVITLSDVEAVLAATTEFFVRVAGEEEVDLFNVPVGTTLRVTPHIFNDNNRNKIKLLVNIEDGSQSAGTQVDNIPVVERANISTQAVVNEGDSLLVGGLVRESYRDTGYQVPVLGKIPLFGGLFRSTQKQATRVERLFMITPRLAAGIGFQGGGSQPSLAGRDNQIIRDAANRVSGFDSMQRAPVSYWSERSREKQTDMDAQTQVLMRDSSGTNTSRPAESVVGKSDSTYPRFATIEGNLFKTPFTVQEWVSE